MIMELKDIPVKVERHSETWYAEATLGPFIAGAAHKDRDEAVRIARTDVRRYYLMGPDAYRQMLAKQAYEILLEEYGRCPI